MLWVTVVASHGQALLRPLRIGFEQICAEVQKGRMVRLMAQDAYRELLRAWISPDDQHDVIDSRCMCYSAGVMAGSYSGW